MRTAMWPEWFFGSSCRVGPLSIWLGNVLAIGCLWAWWIDGGVRPPACSQRLQLWVRDRNLGGAGGGHGRNGRGLDGLNGSGRAVRDTQVPEGRRGGGNRPHRRCGGER